MLVDWIYRVKRLRANLMQIIHIYKVEIGNGEW
jgi:hypothetical protein